MKLLIISHGDFAAGITSTLKTFFQIENVYSACVTQEGGLKPKKPKYGIKYKKYQEMRNIKI